MFNHNRYIQYYDSIGQQLLGSDSVWVFDQRWSNKTALRKAFDKIQKQVIAYQTNPSKYVKPMACYAAICSQERLLAGVPCTLENPLYPDTF